MSTTNRNKIYIGFSQLVIDLPPRTSMKSSNQKPSISTSSKRQKPLTDFFKRMPCVATVVTASNTIKVPLQTTTILTHLLTKENELTTATLDSKITISLSSPMKSLMDLKPHIPNTPSVIPQSRSNHTSKDSSKTHPGKQFLNSDTISPQLSTFPHTRTINQDAFLDLLKLHQFFISFSKSLFHSKFTFSLDEFSEIMFNPTNSTQLMQLFCDVCEYNDLFHVICDFKKYKNLEFDTKVFLQRELECIFHSTTFTHLGPGEKSMKVISNIYGEKEWTEIDGLDHLDALKSLVFHHLTDSVSFLKYLTECTMHVRNESKLKWARNVKKKEMNMETIRLDAEITALDTELGCMKDRLNQDLSNSDPMHLIEDEKELHKEFTRKTNIIHTKRDLIVSEFNRQSALLVKLDKEEVVSTCVIHEFEAILKQSSKLLIGVDRNGTIYWWIQINPELYTVLLEHTDESDPLITLPKSHSELLGMTNSMRMTDSMDSLLRKNLIDKFHKIDVDLNVTLKTRPLITDDPASISGLLNDARLKKSFDWLEQCGIKSNVFDTRCYTDLFKHALPPLMFHCNHHLQLITQKLQSNSILPLYDIALLNSFNLPPIILNLLNFFTLFEKRFDFMFQSFFTEYRQLWTIILFSDLCEWIHSLTDALRSHERGMKRIRNSKESINLQVVEEVIFVDPGVRIRKQVTTLVFDSPVAKRRSVSTRYKTKRKMTVIESEEDKDQVDEEGQENKEDGDEQEEEEEEEEEDGEANFSIDSFKENTKESKKRRLRVDKVETTDKEDTLLWRGRSPRRKRGNDAIVIHYESESS